MTEKEFDILTILESHKEKLSQRELAKDIGVSAPTIKRWLSNLGDYRSDEIYQRIASRIEDEGDRVNNYVSAKWLDQNCPNYRQIIEQTLEELKQEIIANRAAILGGQA